MSYSNLKKDMYNYENASIRKDIVVVSWTSIITFVNQL